MKDNFLIKKINIHCNFFATFGLLKLFTDSLSGEITSRA